ncbi:DNA photolyase [Gordoniibacillus kamchatkensis]|uniref:DNA photolyase n=1 Tax=Gordoniibacillus kamchatkensis TaxID=1590651 RepID=A0ABR5AAW0_9BACL|nr:radical SAM protein [Paenibacillus sp. VKM B-2647]KIL38158.1 DNA photolyase [Paenibacillus sp. VKM B-2647]
MKTKIRTKQPKQLLNRATGFLEGYTHTLNPYAGCTFGCSYCYVRQMPVGLFRGEAWGTWVDVKAEAAEVLRKELHKAKAKGPVTIFMSSSTDPYQPEEAKAGVTRSLLEVMVDPALMPDFLFVQTRSPLVERDYDLLERLGERVRLSMTVETDRDDIRRAFTPHAPPLQGRLRALREAVRRGIPAQATIAPVLPSSAEFAAKLAAVVDRVCIDDYFMGDGSGGRRTERLGIRELYEELGLAEWYGRDAHLRVLAQLRGHFAPERIMVSQAGFLPG